MAGCAQGIWRVANNKIKLTIEVFETMTKAIFLFCIILTLGSCSGHKSDPYNQMNYNLKDTAEGYGVYINKYDTNRTMLKYYFSDNSLQGVFFFYKRKKDGIWKSYNLNGSISAESFFVNGLLDSTNKMFDLKGRPTSIEKYTLGKRINKTEYDTVGNIINFEEYK